MSEEMTYAHLGRSGLLVSRIGLGTMSFGFTVDEPSSFAAHGRRDHIRHLVLYRLVRFSKCYSPC